MKGPCRSRIAQIWPSGGQVFLKSPRYPAVLGSKKAANPVWKLSTCRLADRWLYSYTRNNNYCPCRLLSESFSGEDLLKEVTQCPSKDRA